MDVWIFIECLNCLKSRCVMFYDMNYFDLSCDECIIYDEFILFIRESVNGDKRYKFIPLIDIAVLESIMIGDVAYCVKPLD